MTTRQRLNTPACGTYGGYQRHKRRREPACRACKDAAAAQRARDRGGYRRGPLLARGVAPWSPPNTFARCARQCGRLVWDFDSGLCGACGEAA